MTPEREQEIAATLNGLSNPFKRLKIWLPGATTILRRRARIMRPSTAPQRFC